MRCDVRNLHTNAKYWPCCEAPYFSLQSHSNITFPLAVLFFYRRYPLVFFQSKSWNKHCGFLERDAISWEDFFVWSTVLENQEVKSRITWRWNSGVKMCGIRCLCFKSQRIITITVLFFSHSNITVLCVPAIIVMSRSMLPSTYFALLKEMESRDEVECFKHLISILHNFLRY